jgi:hypothetical protein
MALSNKNALALLIEINRDIEEYASATVETIFEEKHLNSINYPPNGGLTDLEKAAINNLEMNEHLSNALRKILADNSAGIIFALLNYIDGTGVPKTHSDSWTGVILTDEVGTDDKAPFLDTLHDGFYESHWEWRKLRENKKWKLDSYEG